MAWRTGGAIVRRIVNDASCLALTYDETQKLITVDSNGQGADAKQRWTFYPVGPNMAIQGNDSTLAPNAQFWSASKSNVGLNTFNSNGGASTNGVPDNASQEWLVTPSP